jgi:hypothetical protein
MLTKGPLTLGTWARRHSTTVHDGDRRGRLWRPRFRRDRRTEWTTRDAGAQGGVYGRRPNDSVARDISDYSSATTAFMAGGAATMGGSTWSAQGRAATLSRCSRVTAC